MLTLEKKKLNGAFKLTLAQLIVSNVYLASNGTYINITIKPFLLGRRNGFRIFNLSYTYLQFRLIINFVKNIVSLRQKILIVKDSDYFDLTRSLKYKNIFFANKKWIGGSLTNYRLVRLCKKFKERNVEFNSLKNLRYMPSIFFGLDPNLSRWPLFECFKLRIPISAIVNMDSFFFESINYPIVGNNKSFESLYLYINIIGSAVDLGIQKERAKILNII